MKYPSIFLIVFLVFFLSGPAAAAVDITFSDLQIVKGVSIIVYNSSGSLVGEYNTTSSLSLPDSAGYVFVVKPTEQSWFSDPVNTIQLFTIWLPPMLSYLTWLVVIVGTVFIVSRLWK